MNTRAVRNIAKLDNSLEDAFLKVMHHLTQHEDVLADIFEAHPEVYQTLKNCEKRREEVLRGQWSGFQKQIEIYDENALKKIMQEWFTCSD